MMRLLGDLLLIGSVTMLLYGAWCCINFVIDLFCTVTDE